MKEIAFVRQVKDDDMLNKIEDVRKAIQNGTYYSALALALTFPDICCQVENGLNNGEASNRSLYIDWVNKHMDFEDFHFPIPGFETQTFAGEMCYSLRCKVLHNGNTEVYNDKLGVIVDKLVLTTPKDNNYFHGYRYAESPSGETATYIGIDYVCERLCDTAEKFYNSWSNKSDFDKHSF